MSKKKKLPMIAGLIAVFFAVSLLLYADTNAMFIDKAGNVGIGTENPQAKLDVNGDLRVSGKLQDATGFVMPVGAIFSYYGTTAPEGWLLCNGQTIPADAKYDALRALCGGNIPDLRGVFLRGLDNSRGLDPDSGRGLGSYQEDALFFTDTDFPDDCTLRYTIKSPSRSVCRNQKLC
jgi:hypothetical protein